MTIASEVFYTTKHYNVVAVGSPRSEERRSYYGIINKKTMMVEYYIETFDNAMIAAETLSYILDSGSWRRQVRNNIEAIDADKEVAEPEMSSPVLAS